MPKNNKELIALQVDRRNSPPSGMAPWNLNLLSKWFSLMRRKQRILPPLEIEPRNKESSTGGDKSDRV